MLDRVLHSLLWLTIMGMVMLAACSSLALGYSGFTSMICGEIGRGVGPVFGAILLGGGTYALCRHSNDLIDR